MCLRAKRFRLYLIYWETKDLTLKKRVVPEFWPSVRNSAPSIGVGRPGNLELIGVGPRTELSVFS